MYDYETNIETTALLSIEDTEAIDILYPAPKLVRHLAPLDVYLVRKSTVIENEGERIECSYDAS